MPKHSERIARFAALLERVDELDDPNGFAGMLDGFSDELDRVLSEQEIGDTKARVQRVVRHELQLSADSKLPLLLQQHLMAEADPDVMDDLAGYLKSLKDD